jgi:CheY-like chemotaxis protein/DNA-binding XRE family transcriptional regulator
MNTQGPEARTHFATSLKRWRRHRGLSQEELAERANLHRTYISDVERGARNLSLESIDKLARALEISVPILFSDPLPQATSGAGVSDKIIPQVTEFVDILLVEDNPDDVELTLQAFKRARFANSVRIARDGAEALDLFFGKGGFADHVKDAGHQIILLDLNLPKVSGMEVLRRLKADKRTAKIPVLVLTVSDKDQDINECRRLGASAFITKPVSFHGLSKVTPDLCLVWALIKPAEFNAAP